MKKIFTKVVLLVTLVLLFSLTFTFFAVAENSGSPSLTICSNTLELKNAVFMNFKVYSENITDKANINLLVWDEVPLYYKKGTETVSLNSIREEDDTGYLVFQYDDLSAKEMTKFVYVCAYANINGEEVYSKPVKFSIIQYAYSMLTSDATSIELKEVLTNMLNFGASSQKYFDYNTDFLATDSIAKIKVVNGTHADGFKTGFYKTGTNVILTANESEEGYVFSHWTNSVGEIVGYENTFEVSECQSETYTAFYIPSDTAEKLYRSRDKVYCVTRHKLSSPWILESQKNSLQFFTEFNNLNPLELADKKKYYSDDRYYCTTVDDGELFYYHTSSVASYMGNGYYFSKPLVPYNQYGDGLIYYYHPDNGTKLYYIRTVDSYKLSIYTRYEYTYWKWGEWSEWSSTPIIPTDDKEVEVRGIYTVTYDANGGINAPNKQVKIPGEIINLITSVPTREGYVFAGWSIENDNTAEYNPGDVYSVDKNVVMYAVWTPCEYKISYDANDGENAPGEQTKLHDIDAKISDIIPTRLGYEFKGWSTVIDGEVSYVPESTYSLNSDITLYAVWSIEIYSIVYNANGGDNAPEKQIKHRDIDVKISDIIPTRVGYEFEGWSTVIDGDLSYAPGSTYYLNSNITLYAVWSIKTYTITYDANGGTGAPDKQIKNHDCDLTISISEPICEGLLFSGWSTSLNGEVEYLTGDKYIDNSNVVLYAVWEKANVISKGTCGSNINWHLYDNGKLIISGTGEMSNYDDYSSVFQYYYEDIKTVEIKPGITSIGRYAFLYCDLMESVRIPSTVTVIGDGAFVECISLCELTIPEGVTRIGTEAFSDCKSLSTVTIPEGVTSIGVRAFYKCQSLTKITIPTTINTIEEMTFGECHSLTNINIPSTITNIGDMAFGYCKSLENITIPDSVTSIGEYAFYACSALISINIPKSVTKIGMCAFNSSLLTTINVSQDNVYFSSYEGHLFNKNKSEIIQYSSRKTETEYVLPDSVTTIKDGAFYNCSTLERVILSNNVVSIGEKAFYGCKNIETIIFKGAASKWDAVTKGEKWDYNVGKNTSQGIYDLCLDSE